MFEFIKDLNGNEYQCGMTSIVFANAETFDDFQLGFRTDGQQKDNLISNDKDSWKENWYVIAKDTMMGDPYFIDTTDNKIYYVGHDCDFDSSVEKIVDSLDSFVKICERIGNNFSNITIYGVDLKERIKLADNTLNDIKEIDDSVNSDFFKDSFNVCLDIELKDYYK